VKTAITTFHVFSANRLADKQALSYFITSSARPVTVFLHLNNSLGHRQFFTRLKCAPNEIVTQR
jgi:hypothetical protein